MRKYHRASEGNRTDDEEGGGGGKRRWLPVARGWIDCVSLKLANLEQIPTAMDDATDGRTNRSKCEDSKFSPRGPRGRREGSREEEGDLRLTELKNVEDEKRRRPADAEDGHLENFEGPQAGRRQASPEGEKEEGHRGEGTCSLSRSSSGGSVGRRRNPGPNPAPDHPAVRVQNQDEGRSPSGGREREGGREAEGVDVRVRPSVGEAWRSEGTFAAQLSAIMIVMNMYDFVGRASGRGRPRCDGR